MLVKVEEAKAEIAYLDKGKHVLLDDCVKPKYKASIRNQTSVKFVPICHHYGKIGHIRPNYFQLKYQRPWDKKVVFVSS